MQGVEQIRNSDLNPILVFINPPSIEELERRLRGRATETDESLKSRLETAKHEIQYGKLHSTLILDSTMKTWSKFHSISPSYPIISNGFLFQETNQETSTALSTMKHWSRRTRSWETSLKLNWNGKSRKASQLAWNEFHCLRIFKRRNSRNVSECYSSTRGSIWSDSGVD